MNRKSLLPIFVSLGVFVVLFAGVALYLTHASQKSTTEANAAKTEKTEAVKSIGNLNVTTADIPVARQVIGGDLKVTGNVSIVDGLSSSSIRITPTVDTSTIQVGQLYSTSDNSLYYYDGRNRVNISSFPGVTSSVSTLQNTTNQLRIDTNSLLSKPQGVVTLQGQSGNITLSGTDGIVINGTTVSNTGVLTVQGKAGNVQFSSGTGVAVNGTTITNTGVTSIGAQTGDLALGTGLAISNGTLTNTGITQVVSGSADITVSSNGAGTYTIGYAGSGVGGTVALDPSVAQQDSGTNPSLWINKTGLGNLIQLSTGTTAANKFVVDQTGTIVNGSINFSQVTGTPSLVNSIGGLTGTITVGSGLAVSGGQLVATSAVRSLTGTANQVMVSGTDNITLSLPQDISVTSTPTFAGVALTNALTLANGGTGATTATAARNNLGAAARGANSDITSLTGLTTGISVAQGGTGKTSFTANSVLLGNGSAPITSVSASGVNQCLVSASDGTLSFQSCPGSTSVSSLNGLNGSVSVAAIDPSSIVTSGSTITIQDASTTVKGLASFTGSNFTVTNGNVNTIQNIGTGATPTFAGLSLSTALGVANGGTGATSFAANSLLVGQGTNALSTVRTTLAGQCLVTGTGGALSFADCPGASGVSSLNGQSGAVTVTAIDASSILTSGSTITVQDASTTVKGLASFNSTNFTVTNGAVNTKQNITTTSTPTFAGLNLGSALSVANGGTGVSSLAANGLVIGNGTGAVTTLSTTDAGKCLVSGAGGQLEFLDCPGTSVVNSLNGESGTLTISGISPSSITTTGGAITVNDASTTVKGLASFNGSNFSVTNGAVNTVQNIGTAASPTFGGLTLTSALSVTSGGTGRNTLAANSLLVGQGASAVSTLGTTTADQCLISGVGGVLGFAACPGTGGVSSINGLAGAVTIAGTNASSILTSGNSITVQDASSTTKGLASFNSANLVVTGGSVNTVQNISSSSTPSFAGVNLSNALAVTSGGTGLSSLAANGVLVGNGTSAVSVVNATAESQCLISASDGTLSFQSCPGSGGVLSVNGATGVVTVAAVSPSSITTSGGTITINDASTTVKGLASFNGSNFSVTNGVVNTVQDITTSATPTFAGLNLTAALSVANGGTGRTTLAANSLLVGQGNAAVASLGTTTAGQCLVTGTGGVLSFATCPGNDGVTSVNGLAGALTINATSASSILTSGSSITVQDASTTVKGLASFDGTNLVVTNGAVNTAQNITTSATPTFAGLSLGSALSVANGGTGANIFAVNGVLVGNGTSAVSSLTSSGSNQCLVSASDGTLSFQSCPGSGGVSSVNGQSGALTLGAVSPSSITTSGSTITVNDASSTVKGLSSFNGSNFTVTNGAVNTIQDIGTGATPTFAGLNLGSALTVANGGTGASDAATARGNLGAAASGANADITSLGSVTSINSSSDLNVGSTSGALKLQGVSVELAAVSGGNTSKLTFVSPTANVIYRLQTAAAGTYDVCTTAGNCVGAGGGVTTSGGTIGKLSRFVSGSAIGDSIITDNGSTVSIGGTLSVNNITPTAAAIIGATTQSLTLQGAATSISSTSGSSTNTLSFVTPAGANKTINIPNASGTVAVSATGPIVLDSAGNLSCPSCLTSGGGGGTSGVSSLNGATGTIVINSTTPSSIVTSGTSITIQDASVTVKGLASFNSSNFSVSSGAVNTVQDIGTTATPTFANITLTSPLAVTSGGTGKATLPSNSLLIGNGTGAVSTLSPTAASQCLASDSSNNLTFVSCPGTSVVNYLNGLNGTITIAGTTGSSVTTAGSAITIQDASATVKGLASFDGTNLVVTNGAVNTAQNITTSATPTFAGLNLTTALGVAQGGTGSNVAATARANLGAAAKGANSDITSLSGLTTVLSVPQGGTGHSTFTAGGVVYGNGGASLQVSAAGTVGQCLVVNASNIPVFGTCTGAGGVSSVNSLTGAVTLATTTASSLVASGNTLTLQDASSSIKGLASFNSANLTVSAGVVNTIQNISTTATPTFGGLNLGAALSVANGGTGTASLAANGVVVGNGTSALSTVGTSTAGQCLVSGTGGTLSFASCPGSGGVSSVNGQTGAVTIAGTTASSVLTSGGAVTIQDASATVKGLASFNTTNLTVSAGAVNTVQNINTSATPTFAGLNLTSALSVANGGTGKATLAAGSLVLGNGTGAVTTLGTTDAGKCLVSGSGGALGFVDCPGTAVVNSLNGQSGAVTLSAVSPSSITSTGGVITVNDASTTVKGLASFNGSNFSVSAGAVNTVQDITTSATPTFGGLTLTSSLGVSSGGTGTNTLATNGVLVGQGTSAVTTVGTSTAGQCLVSSTGGVLGFADCPGAGGVTTLNGQNGAVTIAGTSASSILSSAGSITIKDATSTIKGLASFNSANLTVTAGAVNTIQNINTSATPTFAGLNLTSALTVANGGTGASTLAAGSLLIGNGTGAVTTLGTTDEGKCLASGTGGALGFVDCPGTTVVSSLNGQTGSVTISAASPSSITSTGGVITFKDASATVKGLASFNGSNFSVSAGAVNTVQDITTTATPTFGGLTLTSALSVANGGTGATTFATNGLLLGQGTGAVTTVGTSTAGQCLVSGTGGAVSFASCPGSGGVSSVNGQTGAITVTGASASSVLTSGTTVTIQDASSTVKGLASFNSANLVVTAGAVNTIQNISTASTPTFAGLNLTSALSVANGGTGSTSLTADRVLLGNGTSGVAVTNAATSGFCLIGNVSGAPSFQACPVGGNISSGAAQTPGAIAMFDATTNKITNSILTQSSGAISVSGQLTATSLVGNGSALSALNASNITSGTLADAQLSTNVTVQGNAFNGSGQLVKLDTAGNASTAGLCLMSTGTGGGTSFQTCPGGSAGASANTSLSNLANVAINTDLLPGAGNSYDLGSVATTFRNLNLGGNVAAAGTINGLTVSATSIQAAGALSLSAGGTNQNISISGSGTGGVTINKGSGALTLTGLTCSTFANGGKLTSNASGVVNCADDIGGVSNIGALDSQTKSANGAVISGNTIYLQSADATNPGIVTATAQTLGGAKTFTGNIIASAAIQGTSASGSNAAGSNLSLQAGNGTGTGGSGDIVLYTAPPAGGTPGIGIDSPAPYKNGNSNAGTFSYTVPTGINRMLVVSVMTSSAGSNVNSMTYGGVAMTKVVAADGMYSVGHTELWYLLNPTVGTASITASFSGYRNTIMHAVSMDGVNQTTPFGTPCTNAGAGVTASCATTTSTNDRLIDTMNANAAYTLLGTSQTSVYANDLQSTYASMTTQAPAAGTNTNNYTFGSTANWGMISVAVHSASTALATDSDTMTDRLHIKSNGFVGINNNNPQYALDVTGAINTTSTLMVGGNTTLAGPLSVASTINATGTVTISGTGTGLAVTNNATIGGTLTTSGATLFKNTTNSTLAFAIQNATSGNLFAVDTTNSKLGIGAAPTTTGSTLQVTGDVSATTGFSLYNGSSYVSVLAGGATPTLQNITIAAGTKFGTAAAGVVYTDATGALQKVATSGVTAGYCLGYNGSALAFQSCGGSNGYIQGGNAFGATGVLGTTDAQAMNIVQGGSTRISLGTDGNINLTPGTNKFVFVNSTSADSDAALIVGGGIKATGYKVGTLNGVNIASCTSYIQGITVTSGLVTAGTCNTGGSAGVALVQGGNAFNGTMTLGTTDNNGINIIENGTNRISISQSGDIDFTSATNRFVRVNTTDTDSNAAFTVGGVIKSTSGFRVGTTSGTSVSCNSANQTLGAVTVVGGIVTQASCATNNSDLAENYNSTDSLEAGELVMATTDGATSVRRATGGNNSSALMGVVSTNPGKVLGTEQVPNGYPIALSGRVPVKVNGEGGAISVGDKITISSVDGIGKKATGAGMIVGTAVESFSGTGTGSIEVFVNLTYYNPVDGNNLQAQTGTFTDLNVSGNATLAELTVTGAAHFKGDIIIAGHIVTGGSTPSYAIEAAAGAGASATIDGNDTSGTITITTGADGVVSGELMNLVFTKHYGATPRILISGQDDASLRAFIHPSAKSANGFSMSTSETLAPSTTYTFDYFIVQ